MLGRLRRPPAMSPPTVPPAEPATVATAVAAAPVASDSGAVDRAILAGIGGKVLMTVFSLIVVAAATRSLGPAGFGVVAVLTGLVTTLGFLDLGIGNAAISTISASLSAGDERRARRDVGTALIAMSGIGALIAIVGTVAALCVPRGLVFATPGVTDADVRGSLVVFAVAVGIAIPGSLGSRIALARQRGAANNLYLVIGAVASAVCALACALAHAPVWAFTVAAVLVPVLALAAQTAVTTTVWDHAIRPDLSDVSWARTRVVGRASSAYMILGGCSALTFQTNALVVAYVLDSRAAGILGVATRVFSLVSTLFIGGLQQSWASSARALAAGHVDWVRANFWRVLRLTGIPVVVISVGIVLVGQPVIRLWAGAASVPPLTVLIPLAVWTCYNFAMTQMSFLLNAANVLRPQVYLAVALLVVGTPLGVVLTDRIGIAGSTVAILGAHLAIACVPFIVLTRRILRLPDGVPIDNAWRQT